ncbi:hypothetical protein [Streptomyces sp. NPDC059761]|uniref:hypothetical protein n=1 Tax=Streptomyces sp. NPDC059761 TaxID=3346937 RepID=UPI0036608528
MAAERERAVAGETHSPDARPRRPSASHITDVELDELFRERDGYLRLAALLVILGRAVVTILHRAAPAVAVTGISADLADGHADELVLAAP